MCTTHACESVRRMADEPLCKRSRRERWLELRIRVFALSRVAGSRLLRPGAKLTTVVVAIYGAATLANAKKWPEASSWTSTGGTTVLVGSGIAAILGYCLVTLGYSRTLRRHEEDAKLSAACRSISRMIEASTGIDHRALGVHIWTTAGWRIAPHLARRVRYLPEDRQESGVTWVRGKGVIGGCWADNSASVVNLRVLERLGPTKEAFCALAPRDRLNLTWEEFQRTSDYRTVCALPLRGGPEGAKRFVGCVSIDVSADGYVDPLRQTLVQDGDKLGRILTVCEALLSKET